MWKSELNYVIKTESKDCEQSTTQRNISLVLKTTVTVTNVGIVVVVMFYGVRLISNQFQEIACYDFNVVY
jgi:hypothetical protein